MHLLLPEQCHLNQLKASLPKCLVSILKPARSDNNSRCKDLDSNSQCKVSASLQHNLRLTRLAVFRALLRLSSRLNLLVLALSKQPRHLNHRPLLKRTTTSAAWLISRTYRHLKNLHKLLQEASLSSSSLSSNNLRPILCQT